MKISDQQLLEEAYKQIALSNHLHQAFLIEAGLIDKAKQAGGAILDKAKSMFGSTVAGLLEIVKKQIRSCLLKYKQQYSKKMNRHYNPSLKVLMLNSKLHKSLSFMKES